LAAKRDCQCGQPGVGAEPVTTEKKENEPVVKTEMEVDDSVVAVLKVQDESSTFLLIGAPALRLRANSLLCLFADSAVPPTSDAASDDR
jgi:hypothetical protein